MIKLSLIISKDNLGGVTAAVANESSDITDLELLLLADQRKNGFQGYMKMLKISLDALADSPASKSQ
jgi:hypothetical protein